MTPCLYANIRNVTIWFPHILLQTSIFGLEFCFSSIYDLYIYKKQKKTKSKSEKNISLDLQKSKSE